MGTAMKSSPTSVNMSWTKTSCLPRVEVSSRASSSRLEVPLFRERWQALRGTRGVASNPRCEADRLLASKRFRKLAAPHRLCTTGSRALKIASRFTYATVKMEPSSGLREDLDSKLSVFNRRTKGCRRRARREPTTKLEGSSGRRFRQRKCQEALPTSCAPGPGLPRC